MNKAVIETTIKQIIKPQESDNLLFVTDSEKKELAIPFFDYCVNEGLFCNLVMMPPTENDGEEPTEVVAIACQRADVIIAITKWSITHTKPLQKAKQENGAKIISMPAVTKEMLERALPVDYQEMKQLALQLEELLTDQPEILLKTTLGTNLKISTVGFSANPQYGKAAKGKHMNLPDGECSVGVETADGVLVIDGSMPPDQDSKWGKIGLIKEPIQLLVREGVVVEVSGGKEAAILEEILQAHGKSAYRLAELGVGVNPNAKVTGNVTEDEKALGTVHIALGNNTGLGGDNYSTVHLDGVLKYPTLTVDKKTILKNGEMKLARGT